MPKIFKFGGALLSKPSNIKHMFRLVEKHKNQPLVIIVSAIGKTTNNLEKLYHISQSKNQENLKESFFKIKEQHFSLVKSLKIRNEEIIITKLEESFLQLLDKLNRNYDNFYEGYDQVISFGEKFSGIIIYHFLQNKQLPVKFIDACEFIQTDNKFTNATVQWEETERIIKKKASTALNNGKIILTQGFIASNGKGLTTTLGREGSDFSAAIIAYSLNAREVCIWKDVPGLMNADPRIFPDAIKIPHISYNEAIELAFYGASVIHPKTIQPLKKKNIILKVCPFFQPDCIPTLINSSEIDDTEIPKIILKKRQTLLSISSKNLEFITEENFLRVFEIINSHRVHINLMQNSAVSFSIIFDENMHKLNKILEDLNNDFILKYNQNLSLLTIRHYNDKIINKYLKNKEVFLSQKNRTTIQILIK